MGPLLDFSIFDDALSRKIATAFQNIKTNMAICLPTCKNNADHRHNSLATSPNQYLYKEAKHLLDHNIEIIGLFLTDNRPNADEYLVFNTECKKYDQHKENDTYSSTLIFPHSIDSSSKATNDY